VTDQGENAVRNLRIIAAFSIALSVPLFSQVNAPKKTAPRPSNPSPVVLKMLIGRHLYVCGSDKQHKYQEGKHVSFKSKAGYLIPDQAIKDYFLRGEKLTIVAVDMKPEPPASCADCVTALVTLRNEEGDVVTEYPVEIEKKDITPTRIYHALSELGEFSSQSPGIVIGSSEHDVYCYLGNPEHMNEDVYMLQLVYFGGTYIAYVDNRTGKVVDIQKSY
jgi:hypothetical protein